MWSDVGNRDLSTSIEFHRFIDHLISCPNTGFQSSQLVPVAMLGKDTELKHSLPPLETDRADAPAHDGSFKQWASHIPTESHLLVDPAIAARDPLYALTPVIYFAAAAENQILGVLTKRYEIITSTVWDAMKSTEHLEQLILQKHILDDHASRHEEVLRFLRSSVLSEWTTNLTTQQTKTAAEAKQSVEDDYEYLLRRTRQFSVHHQEAISILVSSVALAESKKQITLATQVTKLTILATVFLPLSYCTSIFGMNFVELEALSIWMWAVVTVSVGIATFVVYQWNERQRLLGKYRESWASINNRIRRMANTKLDDITAV
jgi:hypothetical protein